MKYSGYLNEVRKTHYNNYIAPISNIEERLAIEFNSNHL